LDNWNLFGIWNFGFGVSTAKPGSGGIDHDEEFGLLIAKITKFVGDARIEVKRFPFLKEILIFAHPHFDMPF
jgi:hypothetical protein